ncbi:MAG: hypothetical protein ACJ70S_09310 [Nitrososphaera sp.]
MVSLETRRFSKINTIVVEGINAKRSEAKICQGIRALLLVAKP